MYRSRSGQEACKNERGRIKNKNINAYEFYKKDGL